VSCAQRPSENCTVSTRKHALAHETAFLVQRACWSHQTCTRNNDTVSFVSCSSTNADWHTKACPMECISYTLQRACFLIFVWGRNAIKRTNKRNIKRLTHVMSESKIIYNLTLPLCFSSISGPYWIARLWY